MSSPHKPPRDLADPKEVLLGFLDYYRCAVARKLDGLAESDLRVRPLPSGWMPLELINHLAYMERRWVRWGFAAEAVVNPAGDENAAGRWAIVKNARLDELVAALHAEAGALARS